MGRATRAARAAARTAATAVLLACLTPSATAAPEPSIAIMRRTFAGLDRDGDVKVSAEEAVSCGLAPDLFVKHDRDRDGLLDGDEFTMLYHDLLVRSRRIVPRDIADEVARVRARIRAREDARRRGDSARSAPAQHDRPAR